MNLPLLFLIGLLLAAALVQCATSGLGAGEGPAPDAEPCGAEPEKPWVHQFALREGAEDWRRLAHLPLEAGPAPGVVLAPGGAAACHESPVLAVARAFNEALLSWNVDVPPGSGFVVEMRVGRARTSMWSPWLRIGSWGSAPLPAEGAVTSFAGGRVDIDVFRSDERYDRLQYRVTAQGGPRPIVICRVACCLSDGSGLPQLPPDRASRAAPDVPRAPRLDVPFFSQTDADPAIRRRVCSPVSVAMVLAYYGKETAPAQVAERLFDAEHGIYGNWARAVQGAYAFGVPGFLARFSCWDEAERLIAAGRPLIITIAAQKGQLSGAPYESTNGHLLVVTGFDAAGNVAVNDSAADAGAGRLVYSREQMEQVWMRRGGTAYVLLPPRP